MSFVDLEQLSDRALLATCVLEIGGAGLCLSRQDHERLEAWLAAAGGDVYRILLILDDLAQTLKQTPARNFVRQLHPRILARLRAG